MTFRNRPPAGMTCPNVCLGVQVVWLMLIAASPAPAADWPQWRGPSRDGISAETNLLREWPKDGPKLLWQTKDLGSGYSTPAVADGRIYMMVNKGIEDERVKSLDAKNGREVWSTRLGKVGSPDQQPNFPAARSTPTVDGQVLYALSSDGDLVCLNTADGRIVWRKSLTADFGGKPGTWAYAESPLIDGEQLVCVPGGPDATVVALNKKTGEVLWKCPLPGGDAAGYASVIIVEAAERRQYVAFPANGLIGVDAKTGRLLWRYEKTKGLGNIVTPVARDGLIYSSANFVGGGLIRLTTEQGGVKPEQVYFDPKLPTAIGGAVLVGDSLYGCGSEALLCVDFKTGQVKWSERSAAPGSLCCADGRLYLHGENGEVVLIEPSAEGYQERGRFSPPQQPVHTKQMEKAWSYPVIANGRLLIRDLDCLWCYDVKASKPAG